MADKYKEESSRFLQNVITALPGDASQDLKNLTAQFYGKLPLVDTVALDPKDAAQVVVEAYAFIGDREAGKPKIQVTSHARHTVLTILNDDMPFLVDSLTAELSRQGLTVSRLAHPILRLKRDVAQKITKIADPHDVATGYAHESLIRVELTRLAENISEEKLASDIRQVLTHVRYAVMDWPQMQKKIEETAQDIKVVPAGFKQEEATEVQDFLRWLADRNFVFLGYIEYDFFDEKGEHALSVVEGSELGIFKADDAALRPKGLEGLPPEILHFALVPQLMEITKSMRKAMVHRPVHMDYIGFKRFDKNGKVIGERRFLGLFTSTVYYQSASDIPFIRRRIARVISRANYDPASHDGKTLKAILEFTPRDELFQFSEEDLFEYAMGVVSLETSPRVRLFIRRDAFERFISCIVFVPRERFSTNLREAVFSLLCKAFQGTMSTFYTQMTDAPLARVQYIIATTPGQIPAVNTTDLEEQIAQVAYQFSDALFEALRAKYGVLVAEDTMRVFATAFPAAYVNNHDVQSAVYDIQKVSHVIRSGVASLELFRTKMDAENMVHLKWYNPHMQIALSDVLPILENMGFRVIDEQPYVVHPSHSDVKTVWIRDFILEADAVLLQDIDALKPLFEDALAHVWQRDTDNDALNALILHAQLHWREVVMLRAYAKYLRQIAFPYGLGAIAAACIRYPHITRALVQLFQAQFNPALTVNTDEQAKALHDLLAEVQDISDDRILRRLFDLISATLRTNYYQKTSGGEHKPYLSFKLNSAHVPELPLPRPYAEIFVYSPRFEGIHLRGGKVARGGLRWSDRLEDFRTEVLGLMKAQMVKNAVIVPVGSKGGFVLKQAPKERDAFLAEGVACYKLFLCGLLDITDNIVDGNIVPPETVVRRDVDDPYLVVAADKGTATFSDYANEVSKHYGFWLGDAFASGGSAGYDHKKMAITARGAFISVARHFREMDVDIYAQDFSVIGIGDMSGDVFGNGMLLSPHIKLIGAFNHMHIFLDPNPDVAKSLAERKRLFDLPRSSWKDYDASLISKGGGIFERSAKSIVLSPEVREALGVQQTRMSPDELMRAMLLAPVDLLWNGGIGTYVKAEEETHEQVSDRANNAIRVNGKELRCKVVGEGGNLGFTQRGRIEYARLGGRINTDAIDNSAGVDCSDHEVNIKIGLGAEVASGAMSLEARDALLVKMTGEVAALVLEDNRLQTQALSIAEQFAASRLDEHQRLMHALEKRGILDRGVEYLPTDKQIAERKAARKGLTRPELAVLLAYSKMVLYGDLLPSDLPDDAVLAENLLTYFPTPLQKDYATQMKQHPLKREIIATVVTNAIVNYTGITLVHSLAEETGMTLAEVGRAAAATYRVFDLRELWTSLEALDGKVPVRLQGDLFRQITYFAASMMRWFLRNAALPLNISALVTELKQGVTQYQAESAQILSEPLKQREQEKAEQLMTQGIPESLAHAVVKLNIMTSSLDIVRLSASAKQPLTKVGTLYFALESHLGLDWLREQVTQISTDSHWEALALYSVMDSVLDEQRRLTLSVLQQETLEIWTSRHHSTLERFSAFISDLRDSDALTMPKLLIASKKLAEIAR